MSVIIPDPVTTKWVPLGYGSTVMPITPAARVTRSAVQSIPNVVETQVIFDVEQFDNDNIHDLVTNPSRLTCRTPGRYLVMANIGVQSNATGTRQMAIRVNDGAQTSVVNQVGSAADQAYMMGAAVLDLNAGDWLTVTIYQNSGGALNVLQATYYTPVFEMFYIGTSLVSPIPIPPTRTYSSTPPISPKNGDLWDYPVSSNGEIWTFRYNANSSSAYKWEFVGGSEYMPGYNLSNKCTAGATAVFVPGAAFTLARAGDYIFDWGGNLYDEGAWNHIYLDLYDSTAAAAVQTVAKTSYTSTTNYGAHMSTKHRINSVSAGRQYAMTIRNSNGTANSGGVSIGYISVRPIRVA